MPDVSSAGFTAENNDAAASPARLGATAPRDTTSARKVTHSAVFPPHGRELFLGLVIRPLCRVPLEPSLADSLPPDGLNLY